MRRLLRMLLRRRACAGPLLLLLALLCFCYQTLMVDRNQNRSEAEEVPTETRRLVSALEALQEETQAWFHSQRRRHQAVVLTGRHQLSDTEVVLHQWVLQELGYEVHVSRFAETSSFLRAQQGAGGWSLLLCLSTSERSCLRRISFSHLQQHQMVNLLPELMEAFSDVGGGLCHFYQQLAEPDLDMKPHSCGSSNQKPDFPQDSRSPDQTQSPALVAMVNVFVLVTSVTPLTAFMHDISVVWANQSAPGQQMKIRTFLLQQLGASTSQLAWVQIQRVVGSVLQAASTNQEQQPGGRCLLCFQLLTFMLMFSGSITPVVVQVDTKVTSLSEDMFSRQITTDLVLEDSLQFLLPLPTRLSPETHLSPETRLSPETHLSLEALRQQYGGCRGTNGACLSQDELLLLLRFHQQLKVPSAFHLLHPNSSSSSASRLLSDLLRISRHHQLQKNREMNKPTNQLSATPEHEGSCSDPHLRQIYTDPPLILTPPFSPTLKEYRAEVPFDTVTVRIRPEPVSTGCVIHLDNHRGPRMANFPVGLGASRISILVTDASEPHPVVMTIYTVHVYRDSRPSLPMFGDHVLCSFLQDCGLQVQPRLSCGLRPHVSSQSPVQPCSSGHVPGRWVVPCLSCSDNRTCDWREVTWQPDGCYHPLVERPLLQDCMMDRKLLFVGDSTNRGMMYFLMERVNSSLDDWGKAHDTLLYQNLNQGRTQVSYSYYPQFWLEKNLRPTFREALVQLLNRSRPLENSNQTVLVLGGVQWLNTNHLKMVQEVLDRESLSEILVVVKSLGMGFHLPVDGIRSLSLAEIQNLFNENRDIISTAKHLGYEVIDTFSITMGRYKEFLQGRCACHFHEVEKIQSSKPRDDLESTRKMTRTIRAGPEPGSQSAVLDVEQEVGSTYHVRGEINQVYSEILLSRLCPGSKETQPSPLGP
ncbi:PREDICTED: cadherin-like and PC-esterase domain-containing protein 1 isoform X2 [Cyprinodon variegatus]|uniref:cadherin-like and PC-esterase domain-containing protein 1 isoform X2 n=1 Tax=Cyprinodon variegatus TaxID=28743 RepID=UPI0007427B64|nr:PREDICTED: cadherin-like and PC-esterase domain-containing protein 1 isoform X2 [Cyprinodon variegatus]